MFLFLEVINSWLYSLGIEGYCSLMLLLGNLGKEGNWEFRQRSLIHLLLADDAGDTSIFKTMTF